MAKKVEATLGKKLLDGFLVLMAMNFLLLVGVIVGRLVTNKLTLDDLLNMLLVLNGQKRYVMDIEAIREYEALKKLHKEQQARIMQEKGSLEAAETTARTLLERKKMLEEEIRAQTDLIRKEQETHRRLLQQNRQLLDQITAQQAQLEELAKQKTVVDLSERQKKLRDTLQNMDAEQIARFLQQVIADPREGPAEAARIIREHLRPDLAAEVLGEMTDREVRQILPLLENEYADLPPEKVAQAWTTPGTKDYKNVPQIVEYLKKMAVPEAFAVYRLLDPKIRAQVVQILQEEAKK